MTGICNLASVIENDAPIVELITGGSPCALVPHSVISVKTQFLDHVKTRFTLQLSNAIFKVLQKLL